MPAEVETTAIPALPVVSSVEMQTLNAEVNRLKSVIAEQQKQVHQHEGVLQGLTQKGDGVSTAFLTACSVILSSFLAGFFALRNQNNQAAQGRLL